MIELLTNVEIKKNGFDVLCFKTLHFGLDVVVHICNPSTLEAETALWRQRQKD
jgi:hypothetical protein